MAPWVHDPHSGRTKIPARLEEPIILCILAYAEAYYVGKYNRIDVRFTNDS